MLSKNDRPCRRCGTTDRYKDGKCKKCKRAGIHRWQKENKDRHKAHNLKWRESNRESETKRASEWSAANPDKKAAARHRYRTLKTKAGGSYTAAEWEALCRQYDYRCACCGKKTKVTADHVIPVVKGGTSDILNIQPLCKSCNSSKNDKTTDYRTKPGIFRWIQRKLL